MEHFELAVELLNVFQTLQKTIAQKHINDATKGEKFVLHYITLSGGEVLPGEIGCETHVSSARVAATLNSLEKKGLITRQIDEGDRRKILVRITQKGREVDEENHNALLKEVTEMLSHLGENDAKELIRIIYKLANIFNEEGEENNA